MNNICLVGRITKDLEVNYTASNNTAMCKFTLAVNRQNKEMGADFINCLCIGKQAENTAQYCGKGSQVALSGRLQSGSYENKEGKKVYTFEVVVYSIDFISSKKEEKTEAPKEEYTPTLEGFSAIDEDIPF